ncbi:hypothetical protein TL16_g09956 [Triparma laevis f. inornata]|uniref:Helicase ATP-binding domain-containing protein n=1 Tax=Triparma laevis f. inornata TaxID=1714386 RepID=A0A9W7EKU3_9STRA|nr:hypothetical protein TL16_g09956 [Triparma laevis f. inornata]
MSFSESPSPLKRLPTKTNRKIIYSSSEEEDDPPPPSPPTDGANHLQLNGEGYVHKPSYRDTSIFDSGVSESEDESFVPPVLEEEGEDTDLDSSLNSSSSEDSIFKPVKMNGGKKRFVESDDDDDYDDDDDETQSDLSSSLNSTLKSNLSSTSLSLSSPPPKEELPTFPNWSPQTTHSHTYYTLPPPQTQTSPYLPPQLISTLFPHQLTGITWLHDIHNNFPSSTPGGILGDDMGLGKTYQSCSYVLGMFYRKYVQNELNANDVNDDTEEVNNAIIVVPTTLLSIWSDEFRNIIEKFPSSFRTLITISVLSSSTPKRSSIISHHRTSDYTFNILITTYGLVTSTPTLSPGPDNNEPWDYVFLDEGHRIKSPATKMHKSCLTLCSESTKRVLLSGTPIQNNLLGEKLVSSA